MSFLHKHRVFLASFFPLYLIFLLPLMTLQRGFTLGDYAAQFYPWTSHYASALARGYFPLWTPLMQCGFPLFAEGQTGMLYPPNLVLFKLLPFNAAYNVMFLGHFLAGGIFAYLFGKKRGLSAEAAALFALVFTFGSAYAGCFYNIVSMRTLIWFPMMLVAAEKALEGRVSSIICMGWAVSLSFLGGFLQMAAYAVLFAAAYLVLRILEEPKAARFRAAVFILTGITLGTATALPQIWASLELAGHSTRVLQDASFVLWGSAGPWSLTTLFMPSWGIFLGGRAYIGILPFFLLFLAFRQKSSRTDWFLAGLAFFLALGKFNPLYWILQHLPYFSLLRNPSKFLFFMAFFLGLVSARSFDVLAADLRRIPEFLRRVKITAAVLLAASLATWLLSVVLKGPIYRAGLWYVERYIVGKSYHPHTAEQYAEKLKGLLGIAAERLSAADPLFWMPFVFAALFIGLLSACASGRLRAPGFKIGLIVLLAADLLLYAKFNLGTGFLGNIGPFPNGRRFEELSKNGRWAEWRNGTAERLSPNEPMAGGLAIIGAYSPLLDKDYFLLTKPFGLTDDSFGRGKVDPDFFLEDRGLMEFLGVRYLLTDKAAPGGKFIRLGAWDSESYIFRNLQALDEFVFYTEVRLMPSQEERIAFLTGPDYHPTDEVVVASEKDFPPLEGAAGMHQLSKPRIGPMSSEVQIEASGSGVLTRNVTMDPGWKAQIDGLPAPIFRVNQAFQGVFITKGVHDVRFRFEPDWFIIGRWFYGAGLGILTLGALLAAWRSGKVS